MAGPPDQSADDRLRPAAIGRAPSSTPTTASPRTLAWRSAKLEICVRRNRTLRVRDATRRPVSRRSGSPRPSDASRRPADQAAAEGPKQKSRERRKSVLLRTSCWTASAPRTRRLRGSIARPARAPTDARRRPHRRRRTARGHRGSLTLRCWTLPFLSPDRFIRTLPTQKTGHPRPRRLISLDRPEC
jgi:hypothetical protein